MRFIADIMVGKLARYLRMAGNDVVYINDIKDDEIIEIAKKEDRIILTRDRLMLERRDCKNHLIKSLFIKDDKLENQLRQVRDAFAINIKPDLKRCIDCNSLLEEISKKAVEGKVPDYVFKTQENFLFCRNCKKYYWKGTHFENIYKFFKLMENLSF